MWIAPGSDAELILTRNNLLQQHIFDEFDLAEIAQR